jgi:hypothetical protein
MDQVEDKGTVGFAFYVSTLQVAGPVSVVLLSFLPVVS